AIPHADVDLIRLHDVVGDRNAVLALARLGADAYSGHFRERPDDMLRGEQAERELDVVSRRAHDDAERLAVQQELKRLLRGDGIIDVLPRTAAPARDRDAGRLRTRHAPIVPSAVRGGRVTPGRPVVRVVTGEDALEITLRERAEEHQRLFRDRKSTRLNSSHEWISYAV